MKIAASVVIPTRNRVEELRELLRSVVAQTVHVEILVMDDGDSEVTADLLRHSFPEAVHHRLGIDRGPAFQRNRGIELASKEIVFSVDDDALFVSRETMAQTIMDFDHPRIAVVGMPFTNVRTDQEVRQCASVSGVQVAHAFVGAAHAVRREVFLRVGGYREYLHYMGEEGDLCIRMLAAGYVMRLGRADPVHHLESPLRNLRKAGFSGRRNDIRFCWDNVPMPYLPMHLVGTTLNGVRSAVGSGCFWTMLHGMFKGYGDCVYRCFGRRPVTMGIYRLQRELKKSGPRLLSDIEARLPPLRS